MSEQPYRSGFVSLKSVKGEITLEKAKGRVEVELPE